MLKILFDNFFFEIFIILHFQVQQKALQTVQSIFVLKDQRISAPYIIALTPVIVDRLQAVLPENGSKIKDIDELESAVLLEAEKCLDFVLASADSKKRKLNFISFHIFFSHMDLRIFPTIVNIFIISLCLDYNL